MATLLLDRSDLEVRIAGGALALYENGTRSQTIPLGLIDRMIVQGARTKLDSAVLLKLAETGAATLLLSPRASRQVAIVLGPAHNDAAVRLAQAHRTMDHSFCDEWARQVVVAKLRRQHRLLTQAEASRPDVRKPLFDARNGIGDALAQALEQGTTSPRLRGLEGSAARAYFHGYTALFAPDSALPGATAVLPATRSTPACHSPTHCCTSRRSARHMPPGSTHCLAFTTAPPLVVSPSPAT